MVDFREQPDEQAEEILERLRQDESVDVPEDVTAEDVEEIIDPEKPLPSNYKTAMEALFEDVQ